MQEVGGPGPEALQVRSAQRAERAPGAALGPARARRARRGAVAAAAREQRGQVGQQPGLEALHHEQRGHAEHVRLHLLEGRVARCAPAARAVVSHPRPESAFPSPYPYPLYTHATLSLNRFGGKKTAISAPGRPRRAVCRVAHSASTAERKGVPAGQLTRDA